MPSGISTPSSEPPRPPVARRLRRALATRLRFALEAVTFVVPVLTVLIALTEWNGIPGQPFRDTAAYHAAGEAARNDGDIYDPLPPPGPHAYRGQQHYLYLYPPPLAALLALLPRTRLVTFDRAWLCLNIVALWIFAASVARIANRTWNLRSTLRWGAATFFLPGTWLAIHFGNIDMMILALVALGLAHVPIGGAALVLAAVFKVTPVWPLLVRLLRAPRDTLGPAAAGVSVCVAACWAIFGIDQTVALSLRWIRDVMPSLSQGQFWGGSLAVLLTGLHPVHFTSNLSLSFLPVQIAVLNGWPYEGGDLPPYVRGYLTAIAVLAPIAAAWLTRKRSATLQGAVVFAAALFAAPIVRPAALLALLLVLAAARGERRARLTAAAT